jgi:hypothetical protein
MSTDPSAAAQRRGLLLGAKLRTLVADRTGTGVPDDAVGPTGLGVGVGLVADGVAWVLLDAEPSRNDGRGLGPALAWAVRQGAQRVVVLGDHDLAVVARRAALFDMPIEVLQVDGRELAPAGAAAPPGEVPVVDAHLTFRDLVVAAGAEPVVEHGVLAGEVAGLEVCRAVTDANTGEARLEVGIGAHDRETFQMLHGARPTLEALRDVVAHVAVHRTPQAPQHPLNLIAASRLLRSRVVAQPTLLGDDAVHGLVPVAPPVARTNVKDEAPCAALSADGATLVVCSTGIDLDVVPFAADAAAMHGATRCLVAVPARDLVAVQQQVAGLVRVPTRLVAIHFPPVAP